MIDSCTFFFLYRELINCQVDPTLRWALWAMGAGLGLGSGLRQQRQSRVTKPLQHLSLWNHQLPHTFRFLTQERRVWTWRVPRPGNRPPAKAASEKEVSPSPSHLRTPTHAHGTRETEGTRFCFGRSSSVGSARWLQKKRNWGAVKDAMTSKRKLKPLSVHHRYASDPNHLEGWPLVTTTEVRMLLV